MASVRINVLLFYIHNLAGIGTAQFGTSPERTDGSIAIPAQAIVNGQYPVGSYGRAWAVIVFM